MWYAMLLRVQPYLITFLFSKSQYIKNNPIKRMVVLLQPHIKTFTGFPLYYSSIQPLCGSMWSPSYPCFITFVYVYMDHVESTHEGKHVAFYL